MSTSNSLIADIESRIDIVDLVREYVPLKKMGANWKGLSPFKPEKTPSFVVSPAKQIAYCFATNQGGGPLKFLMLIEKIEFREALQILAKRAGVELKTDTIADARSDERTALLKLYQEVTEWYHRELFRPEGLEARNYLTNRGLTEETIRKWKIGFSAKPHDMFESMKQKGFAEKLLLESGIFVSSYKDRFTNRVVFPITNYRGETIAFTGRILTSGTDEAKYVNSPETPIFHKSDVLFGIHLAKSAIQKEKKVIVVEGQMDVIALHQHGFANVVGISGTALTESHIRIIQRLTDQVYLCLDRDSAGKQAIIRSIENLQNAPVDVSVIDIGNFKDPDELLKNGGDFHECIEKAIPAVEFLISEGSIRYDITTTQGKKGLLTEILNHILSLRGSIEVDQAMQIIAKKLSINLQTVYSEYNRAVRGQRRPPVSVPARTLPSGQEYLATYLIGLREGPEVFLRECLFQEEALAMPEMEPVRSLLAGTLDEELKRIMSLRFEELAIGKTEEKLLKEFRECIRGINIQTFRRLQKQYSSDLPRLQELIQTARKYRLV